MPHPYKLLENTKLKASADDIETLLGVVLGRHMYNCKVERIYHYTTKKHFALQFKQHYPYFDNELPPQHPDIDSDGKYYHPLGCVEIIEWSNGIEIVKMYPYKIDPAWAVWQGKEPDEFKLTEYFYEILQELSDELLERFGKVEEEKTKGKTTNQERGPQLNTLHSLNRLREIRLEAIEDGHPIPTKQYAMSIANITDKTWKKYDLELWVKWEDRECRQEKQE